MVASGGAELAREPPGLACPEVMERAENGDRGNVVAPEGHETPTVETGAGFGRDEPRPRVRVLPWQASHKRKNVGVEIRHVAELGSPVAQHWLRRQRHHLAADGRFCVAAPLSNTPRPVYAQLIREASPTDGWDRVSFVLMDEQVDGEPPDCSYVPPEDPAGYEAFARRHLLDPLRRKIGAEVPVLKPDLARLSGFEAPLHLLILALGVAGNYANVMPSTDLSVGWHVAELSEEFRSAHTGPGAGGAYEGATFRWYGMSLGPRQVLDAEEVIVLVSGRHKHDLAADLLARQAFDPSFPLSVIWHPAVRNRTTVYVADDVGLPRRSLPACETSE